MFVKTEYQYCPKCGTNLFETNPNFYSQVGFFEREEASKYLYCKKCDSQALFQKEINFCPNCGKKIEKLGYLHYDGRSVEDLVTQWPDSKKQCKECFSKNLEGIGEIDNIIESSGEEKIVYIVASIGGLIGLVEGGIVGAVIFGFVGLIIGGILCWIITRGGPGYKEISDDKADHIKEKYANIEKSSSHRSGSDIINKGSIISAIIWMTILSILLGWIPLIGPLIAGYVGGKKAGNVSNALIAVAVPALLLAILIYTVFLSIFSSLPIIGALIAGATFTIVIAYDFILLIGAVIGGASA